MTSGINRSTENHLTGCGDFHEREVQELEKEIGANIHSGQSLCLNFIVCASWSSREHDQSTILGSLNVSRTIQGGAGQRSGNN